MFLFSFSGQVMDSRVWNVMLLVASKEILVPRATLVFWERTIYFYPFHIHVYKWEWYNLSVRGQNIGELMVNSYNSSIFIRAWTSWSKVVHTLLFLKVGGTLMIFNLSHSQTRIYWYCIFGPFCVLLSCTNITVDLFPMYSLTQHVFNHLYSRKVSSSIPNTGEIKSKCFISIKIHINHNIEIAFEFLALSI